jgi:hypothetical protein
VEITPPTSRNNYFRQDLSLSVTVRAERISRDRRRPGLDHELIPLWTFLYMPHL